jgi:hypothetical protein
MKKTVLAFTPQVCAKQVDTPGDAISYVERADLDAVDPTWSGQTPADVPVAHYTYDERDPRTFYVYPAATGVVELVYTCRPALIDVTELETATISVADTYVNNLVDFVLFRALSKSTEAGDFRRAATYAASFQQSLGITISAKWRNGPDQHTATAEQREQLK